MRQAGLLAAAGLYALDHQVARLADDHANAARLGDGLRELGYAVEPVQTNMVYVDVGERAVALRDLAEARGADQRGGAFAPGHPPGRFRRVHRTSTGCLRGLSSLISEKVGNRQ